MAPLLFVVSILAFLLGALVFMAAKGAPHEIEGLILVLIAAVLFSAALVVHAINRVGEEVRKLAKGKPQAE